MGQLRHPAYSEREGQSDRLTIREHGAGWYLGSTCHCPQHPRVPTEQPEGRDRHKGAVQEGWQAPGTGLSPALRGPGRAPAHGTACADTGPGSLLAPHPWHQAGCQLPPPLKMTLASCPRAKSSLTSIRHSRALRGGEKRGERGHTASASPVERYSDRRQRGRKPSLNPRARDVGCRQTPLWC